MAENIENEDIAEPIGEVSISPRETSFFDTSPMIRWSIVSILVLALFLFLHIREVRVVSLELGTAAPHFVVAEVPFAFADDEATAIMRQEALLDIGKIYTLDPDDVVKRRVEFENSLIFDQAWRKQAQQSTFDEMCRAVEHLEKALIEVRFSDSRTIEKMKQLSMDTNAMLDLPVGDIAHGIYIPEKQWGQIRDRAFFQHVYQSSTINYVIDFFKEKIWLLKEDLQEVGKIRRVLREKTPEKYTHVAIGSRIIDQGERVTARHISMLQSMKQTLTEKRNLFQFRTILGSILLTIIVVFTGALYLHNFATDVFKSNRKLLLFSTIIILGLGFAKTTEFLLLKTTHNLVDLVHYPLLAPFVAILVAALLQPGLAVFVSALFSTVLEATLAFERQGFLLVNVIVSFVMILTTRSLRRRTEIVTVCMKGWCAASTLIFSLYLYDKSKWGVWLLADIGSAGMFLLLTAVLVVGLLPIFEACFNILTDINLMEYMDPNQELLRRLMIEAPGTYQHSLIMGAIAEAGAQAIGANGLFCRVASLYHDVGKISIAQYFTENQQAGVNIHQLLTPVESAKVIMSHISEGVALARKAGLPEPFIDVIKEHHGTSLVYYFYHKQQELVAQGLTAPVDERLFRYAGPKPKSRECVIIMISDAFEAASRSLEEVNKTTLLKLIDQIIRERLDDGQFDECLLTFEDLTRAKHAMIAVLLSIGHFRVKYPNRKRA